MNRNKRSVTINFKDPDGLELVRSLVKKSDVLVENFIPGKLASMGLGWADCQKLNPRLIYASLSGMLQQSGIIKPLINVIRLWADRPLCENPRV